MPPAIPTLAMCWLASVRHGALFIIDWHNFAYTLMRLSMSRRHPLVRPLFLLKPSLLHLSSLGVACLVCRLLANLTLSNEILHMSSLI